jgi:hypothetical protein
MSQIGVIQAVTSTSNTITGNTGGPVTPNLGNINIVGAGGVSVGAVRGTSTQTITANGQISWSINASDLFTMTSNSGYVLTNDITPVATLPTTAAIGDIFFLVGRGVNGFYVGQNAGQVIRYLNQSTTVGVTGYVHTSAQNNCIELVCTTTNLEFTVLNTIGTFNVN